MAILQHMDEEAASMSHDNHRHDLSAAAQTLQAMTTHNDHRPHRDHRHHLYHHHSHQPRAVLLVVCPVQVSTRPARASRQLPALLPTTAGTPVAQQMPDNCFDNDAWTPLLLIVRIPTVPPAMHESC
jgi:hypothetical protein